MNRRDFIMAMLATAAGPLLPEAGSGITDAMEAKLLEMARPVKLFIALFDGDEAERKRVTFEDMV